MRCWLHVPGLDPEISCVAVFFQDAIPGGHIRQGEYDGLGMISMHGVGFIEPIGRLGPVS